MGQDINGIGSSGVHKRNCYYEKDLIKHWQIFLCCGLFLGTVSRGGLSQSPGQLCFGQENNVHGLPLLS